MPDEFAKNCVRGKIKKAAICVRERGTAATKDSLSSMLWRRGAGREVRLSLQIAPLLGPLPTPPSRGEEGESALRKNLAFLDDLAR